MCTLYTPQLSRHGKSATSCSTTSCSAGSGRKSPARATRWREPIRRAADSRPGKSVRLVRTYDVANCRSHAGSQGRSGIYRQRFNIINTGRCLHRDPIHGVAGDTGRREACPSPKLPTGHRLFSRKRCPRSVSCSRYLRREAEPNAETDTDVDVQARYVVISVPDQEYEAIEGDSSPDLHLEQSANCSR